MMIHAAKGRVEDGYVGGTTSEVDMDSVIMAPRCGAPNVPYRSLTVAVSRVTCPACRELLLR